jgi:hypothetical protein
LMMANVRSIEAANYIARSARRQFARALRARRRDVCSASTPNTN